MATDKKSSNNNTFKTIVRDVVREELKPVEKRLNQRMDRSEKRKDGEFVDFEERLNEKLNNTYRKYRDDVLTGLDQVMGELKTIRQEQTMHQGQHQDLNMLPERVEVLEKIHPHNQHIAV